jgi:hypothetical protein
MCFFLSQKQTGDFLENSSSLLACLYFKNCSSNFKSGWSVVESEEGFGHSCIWWFLDFWNSCLFPTMLGIHGVHRSNSHSIGVFFTTWAMWPQDCGPRIEGLLPFCTKQSLTTCEDCSMFWACLAV